MTDPELVTAAILAASPGNVSAFARLVGVGAPSVFAWRAGSRPLNPVVRRLCLAILAGPVNVSRALTASAPVG